MTPRPPPINEQRVKDAQAAAEQAERDFICGHIDATTFHTAQQRLAGLRLMLAEQPTATA